MFLLGWAPAMLLNEISRPVLQFALKNSVDAVGSAE
jgi:hypothetical protein